MDPGGCSGEVPRQAHNLKAPCKSDTRYSHGRVERCHFQSDRSPIFGFGFSDPPFDGRDDLWADLTQRPAHNRFVHVYRLGLNVLRHERTLEGVSDTAEVQPVGVVERHRRS